MSDGSAFEARGPAMKNALSVTRSRVRETTKLPRALDWSRVSSQRRTSSDRYCGAVPWLMSNIKVHSLNWILLDIGSHYSNPDVTVSVHVWTYTECRNRDDDVTDGFVSGGRNMSWHIDERWLPWIDDRRCAHQGFWPRLTAGGRYRPRTQWDLLGSAWLTVVVCQARWLLISPRSA